MRYSLIRCAAATGLVLTLALAAVAPHQRVMAAVPAAGYALTHTYPLGGAGGWDYLTYDAVRKRNGDGRDS